MSLMIELTHLVSQARHSVRKTHPINRHCETTTVVVIYCTVHLEVGHRVWKIGPISGHSPRDSPLPSNLLHFLGSRSISLVAF